MDDVEDNSQQYWARALTPSDDVRYAPIGCPCEAESGIWGKHFPEYHRPEQPEESLTVESPEGDAPNSTALSLLCEAVEGCAGRNAIFTCGGRLPFDLYSQKGLTELSPDVQRLEAEQKVLTKPIGIRYDYCGNGRKAIFPMAPGASDGAILDLVDACVPATFGRNGKDVFDESYRRAGALSVENFMTDFCPYESGIIDVIIQLLLPPISGALQSTENAAASNAFQPAAKQNIDSLITRVTSPCGIVYLEDAASCLTRLGTNLNRWEAISFLRQCGHDPQQSDNITAQQLYSCITQHLERTSLSMSSDLGGKSSKIHLSKWRGIRAELYKLNVYNGPSGIFKTHVDTPRSNAQIGSLVVCLPAAFEGGALAVRHQGREVIHDWASGHTGGLPFLQWAAFYSDCEHEVLPVTSGSRITLTYNLYLSAGTGLLAGHTLSLQPATLPVLAQLKKTLADETFMSDGGYLGYYLVHSYPHTNETLLHLVPNMLKGADLAVYEAVAAANLTSVLEPIPVPSSTRNHSSSDDISWLKGKYLDRIDALSCKHQQQKDEAGTPPSGLASVDLDDAEMDRDDECNSENTDIQENLDNIGTEYYVPNDLERITWLNTSGGKNEELSMARIAYGNQAELTVRYSQVALIAKVPEWSAGRGL